MSNALEEHLVKEAEHTFTTTTHIPSALEQSEVDHLVSALASAITHALVHEPGKMKFRSFRGFALDYQLASHLAAEDVTNLNSPIEWLKSQADENASIAINDVSTWNLELTRWGLEQSYRIRRLTSWDVSSGFDVYSFISLSGGWTPFGIHRDWEPSLIFHLGPGSKEVWVWDTTEPAGAPFNDSPVMNGVSFDIEENIDSATKFTLNPGDYLCIPGGKYHVFYNTEPSAFLGMTAFPQRRNTRTSEAYGIIESSQTKPPAADVMDSLLTLSEDIYLRESTTHFITPPALSVLNMSARPTTGSQAVRAPFPRLAEVSSDGSKLIVFGTPIRIGASTDSIRHLANLINSEKQFKSSDVQAALACTPHDANRLLNHIAMLGGVVDA